MKILLITFVIVLDILTSLYMLKAEYQILSGLTTRFLNYTFYNLAQESFPNDLVIFISFSRVGGTLLYSIDSKLNQMIISLQDGSSLMMEIELNQQKNDASLAKLCKCEVCRQKPLKLRIQVRDTVNVQCNDGDMISFTITASRGLNQDYPTPTFTKTDNVGAYLWLVNTPSWGNISPNGAQLAGCIFNVTYKNVPLKMGMHQVGDHCPRACTDNICHEGQCLETYNGDPLCNCTGSFKSGRKCNDEIVQQTPDNHQFNFRGIKLAFTNTTGEFFKINNKIVSISIKEIENTLVMNINCSRQKMKIEVTISEKYRREDENILIMEFHDNIVDVKFRGDNKSWYHSIVPHYHDLGGEKFDSPYFEGSGLIDMYYINVLRDFRWIKLASMKNMNANKVRVNTANSTVTPRKGSNLSNTVAGLDGKEGKSTKESTKLSNTESRIQPFIKTAALSGREEMNLRLIIVKLGNKVDAIIGLIVFICVVFILVIIMLQWKKRFKLFTKQKEGQKLLLQNSNNSGC